MSEQCGIDRNYLEGKFTEIISALAAHREENVREITSLQKDASRFLEHIEDEKNIGRDKRLYAWTAVSGLGIGIASFGWHVIKWLAAKAPSMQLPK